jgi:hypothetical protein
MRALSFKARSCIDHVAVLTVIPRILALALLLLAALFIGPGGSLPAAIAEPAEHGLPQKAVEIARPFGFPITNSMVVTWIVAVGLIIFARVATRDMKGVPAGAQNLLEWLVGGLYDFLERIIGPHLVKRTFWFLATVFIFILSANWLGLVPGAGTIGWGHQTPTGFVVDQPLFRGANADLNLTLAAEVGRGFPVVHEPRRTGRDCASGANPTLSTIPLNHVLCWRLLTSHR